MLQKSLRIHTQSNTGRSSCRNNITRLQAHKLAQIMDDIRDFKYQIRGRAILQFFLIDLEPQIQVIYILYFILRRDPGPDRSESITAFSFVPLTSSFYLKFSFADVILERSEEHTSELQSRG